VLEIVRRKHAWSQFRACRISEWLAAHALRLRAGQGGLSLRYNGFCPALREGGFSCRGGD
jgi:hypothetical protein